MPPPCKTCLVLPICINRVKARIEWLEKTRHMDIFKKHEKTDLGVDYEFGVSSGRPCSILNRYVALKFNELKTIHEYNKFKLNEIKSIFKQHIED